MEKIKLIVTIDRPVGYRDKFDNIYPLNYGFIAGVIGGDGEEQDVYVVSLDSAPRDQVTGILTAIIHRADDVETKWVVVPEGETFSKEEITAAVAFMEQYFDSRVEML